MIRRSIVTTLIAMIGMLGCAGYADNNPNCNTLDFVYNNLCLTAVEKRNSIYKDFCSDAGITANTSSSDLTQSNNAFQQTVPNNTTVSKPTFIIKPLSSTEKKKINTTIKWF